MSDHIGPEVAAETARRAQRHPYADHPVSLAIHDHIAAIGTRAPTSPAACECGWRGQACDYPAHLTEMLDQAGLLTDGGRQQEGHVSQCPAQIRATDGGVTFCIREHPHQGTPHTDYYGNRWWDDGTLAI